MLPSVFITYLAFFVINISCMTIVNPGPKYPPTRGEVWPKPQNETILKTYYTFNPSSFKVKVSAVISFKFNHIWFKFIFIYKDYNVLKLVTVFYKKTVPSVYLSIIKVFIIILLILLYCCFMYPFNNINCCKIQILCL